MRIGIDFGSTYSGFSRYDFVGERVEPITFIEGESSSIPSVVSITSKGKVMCGASAKNKVGSKSVKSYEYFKMLLNETDNNLIYSRGYDSTYTPKEITKIFLESNLKSALGVFNENKFEEVYICVPEIWGKNVQTLDGRSILRDILINEVDVPIDHVQVVTEPEAASAFFAYNYEKETNKIFNGYLLLIDYGGGTLDITLTEVNSAGNGNMEIGYREGGGAGENHIDSDGKKVVGNAGIAYIQNIVLAAIKASGEFEDDEIDFSDPDFMAAVVEFELHMKSWESTQSIEDYFGVYGKYSNFDEALADDEEEYATFEYKDVEIAVTYQLLYSVYKNTIEGVLKSQIDVINKKVRNYIENDPCDISAGNNDNFKIALVGGFASCYFVKMQLYEIYNMDSNVAADLRVKNISTNKKEQAISLGAALLAAGKVRLEKTSRYSIGLYASDTSGKFRPYYGIKYHQGIVPGKPYFMCLSDALPDIPENRVIYSNLASINQFVIEFSEDLNRGGLMNLKSEMLERLKELPATHFWNCGFSMDESDVVSFHILPRGSENISDGKTIKLDSYTNMFDLTAVEEVSG